MKPYELDSLVCERIYGWVWTKQTFPEKGPAYPETVWFWLHAPNERPSQTPTSYLEPSTRAEALEHYGREHGGWGSLPRFCADLNVAYKLISGRLFWFPLIERTDSILMGDDGLAPGKWFVVLKRGCQGYDEYEGRHESLPMAIVLAALRAHGEIVDAD